MGSKFSLKEFREPFTSHVGICAVLCHQIWRIGSPTAWALHRSHQTSHFLILFAQITHKIACCPLFCDYFFISGAHYLWAELIQHKFKYLPVFYSIPSFLSENMTMPLFHWMLFNASLIFMSVFSILFWLYHPVYQWDKISFQIKS